MTWVWENYKEFFIWNLTDALSQLITFYNVQGTCFLFCATSVLKMYFLNTDFIWLVTYS